MVLPSTIPIWSIIAACLQYPDSQHSGWEQNLSPSEVVAICLQLGSRLSGSLVSPALKSVEFQFHPN